MQYILLLIKVCPIIFLITGIIYLYVCKKRNLNIKIRKKSTVFFEFTLVGFFVTFIYVTQVMSFGNGMGAKFNLIPLRPFYIAAKYGEVNASILSQIFLNIMMCVPLGFLLPIVFPKRFNKFSSILCASFGLSLSTEVLQLLTARALDIDDIITNTLGGVLGFSIFLLSFAVYSYITKKKSIEIPNYKRKIIFSFVPFIITFIPFIVINYLDEQSEFGHVYYGHIQPANVIVNDELSSKETILPVYKAVLTSTQEEIGTKLLNNFGIKDTEFTKEPDEILSYLNEDSKISLFIYQYGNWYMGFDYLLSEETNETELPKEDEAVTLAMEYLNQCNFDISELEYIGLDNEYGDNNLHLIFKPIENEDINTKMVGYITVSIGNEGKLLSVYNNTIQGEYYTEVNSISPEKSIEIVQDVGLRFASDSTAYINNIVPSYYFKEDTGFLIPVWEINGEIDMGDGILKAWNPQIEAVK